MQSRLALVERDLNKALDNYDFSLNDLVAVQENIIQEQIKLGKIKSEIADVSNELLETQKNLLEADVSLQEQAVSLCGIRNCMALLKMNLGFGYQQNYC